MRLERWRGPGKDNEASAVRPTQGVFMDRRQKRRSRTKLPFILIIPLPIVFPPPALPIGLRRKISQRSRDRRPCCTFTGSNSCCQSHGMGCPLMSKELQQ
eukprot:3494961-Rhodomonas_salina.4